MIPKKLYKFFKKNIELISLLLFSLGIRLFLVLPNVIPFSFDHGRDSIATLHMIKTFSPKLIGPQASIPGLYFGSAWYYFISLGFVLTNWNPMGPVLIMIVLHLVGTYLLYKYFGKLEALIFTTTETWLSISTSAWNPFPMSFVAILILIILKKNKFNHWHFFWIAFLISLSFHFSSAFAVFYMLIIPLILIDRSKRLNQKFDFKKIVFFVAGFIIPFTPQILFEIKYKFIETKAVWDYFSSSQSINNDYKLGVVGLLKEFYISFDRAMLPKFVGEKMKLLNILITLVFFLGLLSGGLKLLQNKKKVKQGKEALIFLIVSFVGFSFLIFKGWYAYALMLVLLTVVAQILRQAHPVILKFLVLFYIISPIIKIVDYEKGFKDILKASAAFLPIKIKAINRIYELGENKSFASYHYSPDVYDYDYQYVYFWKAFDGSRLPTEFSYEPGKDDYIHEKSELLSKLNYKEENPEYIFYIVEKPIKEEYLDEWWSRQNYEKIIYEEDLSNEVKLYQALAKTI